MGSSTSNRRGPQSWSDATAETFRQRFDHIATKRGFGNSALAVHLGVATDHVWRLRVGRVRPSVTQLIAIADACRCSIDWLLGRRDDRGE